MHMPIQYVCRILNKYNRPSVKQAVAAASFLQKYVQPSCTAAYNMPCTIEHDLLASPISPSSKRIFSPIFFFVSHLDCKRNGKKEGEIELESDKN